MQRMMDIMLYFDAANDGYIIVFLGQTWSTVWHIQLHAKLYIKDAKTRYSVIDNPSLPLYLNIDNLSPLLYPYLSPQFITNLSRFIHKSPLRRFRSLIQIGSFCWTLCQKLNNKTGSVDLFVILNKVWFFFILVFLLTGHFS